MSIIKEVGTYIYTGLSLTPGESFFLHNLPLDKNEGVVLQELSPVEGFYSFATTRMSVFIFYPEWATVQNYIDIINDLLQYKYGTVDGEWAIKGEISTDNYGLDEHGRYVTSVSFTVIYTREHALNEAQIALIKEETKTILA